jgi:YD repeat-containing protein
VAGYDAENLLRQIDLPDGAHNYFTYDADSKRVSKQDGDGFTEFTYQGPDMSLCALNGLHGGRQSGSWLLSH